MKKRIAVRAVFLAGVLTLSVHAAEVPAAVPEALRPFAPLVGTKWVATFPSGTVTDEQSFEWVYGGKFLRNLHWVRDDKGTVVYEGETIYAWDPLSGQLVWWYWNTTGGHVTGTITAAEGGWLAEGVNHAPKTQTPKVRGLIRAITPESWESVQLFDREGTWVEQWTIVYRPAKAASSTAKPEPKKASMFIVQYTTGPAWIEGKPFGEQQHSREHSANLARLRKDGVLLLGARHADTGMVILQAESEDAARAEIEKDPAVGSGVFKFTLSEFRPFYPGCIPQGVL